MNTAQEIKCPSGPEDFAIDLLSERLFVSCSKRRPGEWGGTLGFIKINNPIPRFKPFNFDIPTRFNPLGITTQVINGIQYLFAISQDGPPGKNDSRIYQFKVEGDDLTLIKLYKDKLFGFCNSLNVDVQGGIWVTNIVNTYSKFALLLGSIGIKNGSLLYFDPKRGIWSKAIRRLGLPNGIKIIDDALFINLGYPKEIRKYQLSKIKNRDLTFDRAAYKFKKPDNLMLGTDGQLYTACHPKAIAFLRHRKNAQIKSPSRFLKINPGNLQVNRYLKEYEKEISAASVIYRYKKRVFVGQVYDSGILMIDLE